MDPDLDRTCGSGPDLRVVTEQEAGKHDSSGGGGAGPSGVTSWEPLGVVTGISMATTLMGPRGGRIKGDAETQVPDQRSRSRPQQLPVQAVLIRSRMKPRKSDAEGAGKKASSFGGSGFGFRFRFRFHFQRLRGQDPSRSTAFAHARTFVIKAFSRLY